MCFVFLQLRPVSTGRLPEQTMAMAYSLFIFAAALSICNLHRKKEPDYHLAQKGLELLSQAIGKLMKGDSAQDMTGQIFLIQQGLYKEAYQSRGWNYIVNGQGKIKYMFAVLFQRAVYFLDNADQKKEFQEGAKRKIALKLFQYSTKAAKADFHQEKERIVLLEEGRRLLKETENSEEELYVFGQNFLRLFLLIIEKLKEIKEEEPQYDWKLPEYRKPVRRILYQMKPDVFELRFALRLSAVLTIGFTYNVMIHAEHGYWLVLNAFILLRPMFEDSAYRMKTRFFGTAAGCVILHFLLMIFHGTAGHFFLASLMVSGMYMEVPGTWIHAVYVTCFALTMTTLAIPQVLAVELRIAYVAAAVFFVLLINRFFFPTSMKSQFQYNLHLLFHMQHLYLKMILRSLSEEVLYGDICDAQIHFHLVYDQLQQYVNKTTVKDKTRYQEILTASWYMVSNAEQMLFLLNSRRVKLKQTKKMEDYLDFTDYMLSEILRIMDMKPKYKTKEAEELFGRYKRKMDENSKLSVLMEHYAKQVSRIYRNVLAIKS